MADQDEFNGPPAPLGSEYAAEEFADASNAAANGGTAAADARYADCKVC